MISQRRRLAIRGWRGAWPGGGQGVALRTARTPNTVHAEGVLSITYYHLLHNNITTHHLSHDSAAQGRVGPTRKGLYQPGLCQEISPKGASAVACWWSAAKCDIEPTNGTFPNDQYRARTEAGTNRPAANRRRKARGLGTTCTHALLCHARLLRCTHAPNLCIIIVCKTLDNDIVIDNDIVFFAKSGRPGNVHVIYAIPFRTLRPRIIHYDSGDARLKALQRLTDEGYTSTCAWGSNTVAVDVTTLGREGMTLYYVTELNVQGYQILCSSQT